MADLITLEYATAALAALDLPAELIAHLPSAISSASQAIERFCRRSFARADRDEVLAVGWDGVVRLSHYPVNSVARVASGRAPALVVRNLSAANQRATVAFAYPALADLETGLVATGLLLARVASAVTSTATIAFASTPTIGAMASAINALGDGWSASATAGLEEWPSADLVGGEGAISAKAGAALDLFAEDLEGYDLDREAGLLDVGFRGSRREDRFFGGSDLDVPGLGEVRVPYNAGYQAIPADLQDACAEAVKAALTGLALDQGISAEAAGQYSYSYDFRDKGVRLPANVLRAIAPFRDLRA